MLLVLFGLGLFAFGPKLHAQVTYERSKKITKIGGKEYYLHSVKQGQTLWSISQLYNVSIKEIETLNPELKDGLKAGHVLGIPVRPPKEAEPEPVVEEPQPVVKEPEPEPEPEPVVEEPEPEPVVEEPEPEPVVEEPEPVVEEPEPVVEEPEPEPVVEEPEPKPVVVEPEPEPVVEEPEPEPVVEEPEPEPVVEELELEPVVEEPEPEPVVELEPEPVVEEPEPVVEEPEPIVKPSHEVTIAAGGRVVQRGEDLYDIAKEYGIDISDFKFANPGLTDEPAAGTVVKIPAIANENDYIVHYCELNERVSSLLKRWKVDENTFRAKNVSVGSHVFVNQAVLIPICPITDFYWMPSTQEEGVEGVDEIVEEVEPEEHLELDFEAEMGDIPVCMASSENARRRYRVALMVPLYLNDIGNIEVSKEKAGKAQKSRSMSFLQFYEGFMMAAEALEQQGLKLDLTVLDVTDNVSTAERALTSIENKDYDLIVGPFFGKSFALIEEYAKTNGIPVINPLSERESVIEHNPNVIKVKPGDMGMILTLSNLVKNAYSNANVFIVSRENADDAAFLDQLEHHLNLAVNEEVTVSGNEFLKFARDESKRQELGSQMVPTLDVEGQVFATEDFRNGRTDKVVLENPVKRYAYSDIGKVNSQLSGVRTNLIIAYGDDNVFATQMLNALTTEADRFPITLVCAPDWSKFEKLLVDNLLKMNAIYVSDFFVDYRSDEAKQFVRSFRSKYVSEPQKYAFEGYDVGYYFLSALMQYGSDDLVGCLHCYDTELLHTRYRFYYRNYLKSGGDYGKENLYWSIYQYDNEEIELVPVDPFKKVVEDE